MTDTKQPPTRDPQIDDCTRETGHTGPYNGWPRDEGDKPCYTKQSPIPELKPCPFCGGSGVLEVLGGPGSTHRVPRCSKCKCDLGFYPTVEMAVEKWNIRV